VDFGKPTAMLGGILRAGEGKRKRKQTQFLKLNHRTHRGGFQVYTVKGYTTKLSAAHRWGLSERGTIGGKSGSIVVKGERYDSRAADRNEMVGSGTTQKR